MKLALPSRFLTAAVMGLAMLGSPQAAVVGRPLHSFDRADGQAPTAPLLLASDGNWYGTTSIGGANKRGTVFRVTPDGSFSVIHAFGVQGRSAGDGQVSGLSEGPDHALYGTIRPPKIQRGGTVFRVTMAGEFTALHEFGGFETRDPRGPIGPPAAGPDGNLYGVTSGGGEHGLGAVYRMTPDGAVTTIHSFDGNVAYNPNSPAAVSPDGHVFGTTTYGPGFGLGAVYRMDLDGGNFTIVHGWPKTRKEGVFPTTVLLAPGGVIYGSTIGLVSGPNGHYDGLVFKIDADGAFSIVQGFRSEGRAGIQPIGNLALDADGALYGATFSGGPNNAGTVFRITPDGQLQVLATLGAEPAAPRHPQGGVALAPDGGVWLTTHQGGRHHDGGTVVRVPSR